MRVNAGPLGRIPRHKWESLLFSNRGAFVRFPITNYHSRILGPTLSRNGKIVGDGMNVEQWLIETLLPQRPAEYAFYLELKKRDQTAALEYAFVVTGIYEIWKKDVMWLLLVLHYLRKEQEVLLREKGLLLKEEKRILSETEKLSAKLRVPETLKKHFPEFFSDIQMNFSSFEEMMERIQKEVEKLDKKADFLEDYLLGLKRKLPVLFKDLVIE